MCTTLFVSVLACAQGVEERDHVATVVTQARQTYGDFVPNCESSGMLADVHIYEMDLVPGIAFSRAQRQLLSFAVEQHLL